MCTVTLMHWDRYTQVKDTHVCFDYRQGWDGMVTAYGYNIKRHEKNRGWSVERCVCAWCFVCVFVRLRSSQIISQTVSCLSDKRKSSSWRRSPVIPCFSLHPLTSTQNAHISHRIGSTFKDGHDKRQHCFSRSESEGDMRNGVMWPLCKRATPVFFSTWPLCQSYLDRRWSLGADNTHKKEKYDNNCFDCIWFYLVP